MDSPPKQPNCKLLLLTPQNIDPFPPFYPYVTPKNNIFTNSNGNYWALFTGSIFGNEFIDGIHVLEMLIAW